ncbi:MAG: presenilin family intramembrane aspartyl protease [archaeon]
MFGAVELNKELISQLMVLFLVTQLIGLMVGIELIREKEAGLIEQPTIITDNPEDPINSLGLIVYILVFTGILLLIIKFLNRFVGILFKLLEAIVIFGTSQIVLYSVLALTLPSEFKLPLMGLEILFIAILLVIIRLVYRKNILFRNITSVIATAGAGALIGITLGLLPVVLFVIALAIYDLIAVFKTKHMVTLAKAITSKNLSFTFALPTKEHTFEVGTGDMVIPLVFTVSVMDFTSRTLSFPQNLFAPMLVLTGSLVGLLLTMDYSSRNVGKALPALPPQTVIMILMLGLSALLGFLPF